MARLLIVHHPPSPAHRARREAAVAGPAATGEPARAGLESGGERGTTRAAEPAGDHA